MKFQSKKDNLGRILILSPAVIVTAIALLVVTNVFEFIPTIPSEALIGSTLFFWIYFLLVWNFTYYVVKNDAIYSAIWVHSISKN